MKLFQDLQFNEEHHKYTLDGKLIPSMTGVIKELHSKFDLQAASTNVAKKENRSPEAIKAGWNCITEVALSRGHNTHSFAELGGVLDTRLKLSVVQYLDNIPNYYKIVSKEIRMYTRQYWIAGTADLLLKNTITGKYVVVDYKTNKDLFKHYNDYMYHPFGDYLATPYNKYIIQLNGYQIMLEDAGIEIEDRLVIWLSKRSKHALYTPFLLPDVSTDLREYFKNRLN